MREAFGGGLLRCSGMFGFLICEGQSCYLWLINCFDALRSWGLFFTPFYGFQYWVSQGNKWCDFCKIYISNNPSSIRNHELGQRHKDNVAKRLAAMRKENIAKEKEQKETARAIEQIEAVRVLLFIYIYIIDIYSAFIMLGKVYLIPLL